MIPEANTLVFKTPSLHDVTNKEWLITNGIGGYASSTVCGLNTRKYHGLFVPALNPPTERMVMVSKMEESVVVGKQTIYFSTNQYPDNVFPQGYKNLKNFTRSPLPKATFAYKELSYEKTCFMPYGSNTLISEYTNTGNTKFTLRLRPHLVYRSYHDLFKGNDSFNFHCENHGKSVTCYAHHGAIPLYFGFTKGTFNYDKYWYNNHEYLQEQSRGQEYLENTCSPGYIEFELKPGDTVALTITLDNEMIGKKSASLKEKEIKRLSSLVEKSTNNDFVKDLIISADQFIVQRNSTNSLSVIAGYHWFTDWGRDTMIALRGYLHFDDKKPLITSVTDTFINYINVGLLPNRFPDSGEAPEYNTVDGTLWLFVVLYEYYEKHKDKAYIKKVFESLEEVIDYHIKGTVYNIHVNQQGLLYAGYPSTQLTWMDAKIGEHVETPRNGCPVEINALWYNALKVFAFFSEELKLKTNINYSHYIGLLEGNFTKYFYNREGYLNDVVVPDHHEDSSIRPNQAFVLSMPFSLLNKTQEKSILKNIETHLLTPYGLRTLNAENPLFRGTYRGDVWQRDTSYHQGTVWPFLLGEYMDAYIRIHGQTKTSTKKVEAMCTKLSEHFYKDGCVNGISEVFDGLLPNEGKGCIHQAWSVTNILRPVLKYGLFQK